LFLVGNAAAMTGNGLVIAFTLIYLLGLASLPAAPIGRAAFVFGFTVVAQGGPGRAWLTGLLAVVFEPRSHSRLLPESLFGAAKIWGWPLDRGGCSIAQDGLCVCG
jgi:hypothetical protein